MSLFSTIFCCFRTRGESSDEPNEHTRLIQPTEDAVPPERHAATVVDQQKMKERFGTIVGAKGGKMVSVNASLPFNLHNKPLHRISTSGSASRHRVSHSNLHIQGQESNGRFPSPHPSVDTARSSSSASHGPMEGEETVDGYGQFVSVQAPAPALSARLVNVGGRSSSTRGRRGRSVGAGKGGKDRIGEVGMEEDEDDGEENVGENGADNGGAQDGEETLSSPTATDVTPGPTSPKTKPDDNTFKLHVGSISRSWGD